MASVIRELAARLSLESENFNNGLRAAQREATEFQKTVKPTTQMLGDMGKAMTSAGQAATVGLTLPLVAMGAFAVKNFNESAKAAALMENAIRSTGGAAGKSADEITKMAAALESNSIFGDDEIITKVTNQLLTFTNIAGSSFDRATQAALDMSTMLGQDLQTSAIQLGKALNDPIAGVTALQRVGVKLTESQKDLVKAFVESGDIMGAQNVILQELQVEFGGAAEAAARVGSGPMTVLWNRIGNLTESWGELISDAIIPFIDKATTLVEWIDTWDKSTKQVVLVAAALAAAIGPVLLVMGTLASSVSGLIVLYAQLAPLFVAASTAAAGFGVSLTALAASAGPILLTVAAVAGLGVALYKLKTAWDETQAAWKFARFAANETVGTYVKIEQGSAAVVKALTKEQQFAKRLADERAADAKDLDKQYTLYKKNLDDAAAKAKQRAKEISDAHKTMAEIIAASNMRLRDQLERDMTAVVDSHTRAWDTINRIVKANVASNIRTEEEAAARATQLLDLQTDAWIRAQDKKAKTAGETVATIDKINQEAGDRLQQQVNDDAKKWQDVWSNAMGNVVSNFARGVTDMLFEGKNFADSMKELFKDLAATIIQVLVTDAFTKIAKGLSGLLLGTESKGSGGGGFLGQLGGLFGGGGGGSVWQGPINQGAGSAAGGIGSAAGSMAGSMAAGLISGGLGAAGAIIGSLMQKGNLKRTEENTREARDWLEIMATSWDPVIHGQFDFIKEWLHGAIVDCKDVLGEIRDDYRNVVASATTQQIVINVDGQQLATLLIPQLLSLSTNNAVQVTGSR